MIDTEIEYDKIKVSGSKLMISIGNGFSSGGGFYLNPNAVINDGILNLSIFNTVTRRRLLQALPMALINKIDRIPEAKMTSTKSITIKLKSPYFAHCDGEIISNRIINAEISIFKNSINVISKKNI
jgi:diacylglycerol kinase (ATP)